MKLTVVICSLKNANEKKSLAINKIKKSSHHVMIHRLFFISARNCYFNRPYLEQSYDFYRCVSFF